jgi:hypothetical protein
MKAESGRVSYGSRAFHQDATEAMAGDIVRGLIETITNSDDAYGDRDGKIRVEIEHRHGPWQVITRDRAKGMSAARLKTAIVHLGERTSGFESGESVRGNLGRGAKDLAAFGPVTFESICNDRFARLLLSPDGDYSLDSERNATVQDRDRLGIPRGSGTVVTVAVNENIRCPQHAKLVPKLSKHYQLRDIMADQRREVSLFDLNHKKSDILRYTYPVLPVEFSGDVEIAGYEGVKARVTISRNHDCYDDPQSDPLRPAGLLVKGRRAIYENTLFKFENNPFAGWFSGRVECPYIDDLASDYDRRLIIKQQQEPSNPIPIITRRRDGLQHTHPFYRALAAAVEPILGNLVRAEEERARKHKSSETAVMRRTLDALGRDLSRLIDEDLREIDDDGLPGSGDKNLPYVKLIPEQATLYLGEDKTITAVVRADVGIQLVTCQMEPAGVAELVDGSAVKLSPHRKRPDLLTGQIRLRPLLEDESLLTVTVGEHSALALIEVRPEREIVEVEVPPPDHLQFERSTYRMSWTRKKRIRVLAPIELVDKEGKNVRVHSSDAGVVVRGDVKLSLDEDREFYFGDVLVEARTLGAQSTLSANLGAVIATCRIVVTKDEEGPNIVIRIVPEEAGTRRSVVEQKEDHTLIKIMGFHPAIKRYLGSAPEFPLQDLSVSRALVAEIIADQAARVVMERKFPTATGEEQLDAARFYVEHYRYLTKYLSRCHKALIGDREIGDVATPDEPAAGHQSAG